MSVYFYPFLGGSLIGFAAVMMLLFNGKILGVSGIVGGIFQQPSKDRIWRYLFIFGIFVGGALLRVMIPSVFSLSIVRSKFALISAGLLVGLGTRLGGGCTSGHGICGISRLSARSLVATLTFMAFGAGTVFVINRLLGGQL